MTNLKERAFIMLENVPDDKMIYVIDILSSFINRSIIEEKKAELTKRRRHIPLKERLKDYNGNYKGEEWDTGEPVGRELL